MANTFDPTILPIFANDNVDIGKPPAVIYIICNNQWICLTGIDGRLICHYFGCYWRRCRYRCCRRC
ncbi:hypothetical protein DERF_006239 [Dermatophagoides farinae]|uniref:Uncharacterized protein n=1 Tax=Dermatophagoides farinae TaxID=6954 RepID=A0A922I7E3_DERFA|nr:hypothetical protein DERF_006239 [Dermatophagoides farinae]